MTARRARRPRTPIGRWPGPLIVAALAATSSGALSQIADVRQGTNIAVALSPDGASLVIDLLESLSLEFAIDLDRVYLTGQSLGGYGTWDLIAKRPEVFAAAVPLCGEGAPSRAQAVRNVPVWVFHGAKDEAVPVSGSREMVAALRAVGGVVKYTEYPQVGHDVWTVAYVEEDLPGWLFGQKRPSR